MFRINHNVVSNKPPKKLALLFQCAILLMISVICIFSYFTLSKYGSLRFSMRVYKTFAQPMVLGSMCDGRLGNQMFCYASLQGIATEHGMIPAFDEKSELHYAFQTKQWVLGINETTINGYEEYQEEKPCAYDINVRTMTSYSMTHNGKVLIKGYYQSWKYFEKMKNRIRHYFTFCKNVSFIAREFINKQLSMLNGSTLIQVGIHVRRGDMVQLDKVKFGYTVPSRDYFERAMKYFRKQFKNVIFIVCGDDLDWSKKNVIGKDVVYSENNEPSVDMAILASCDHVIMSVGSFGWWAAWLVDGTTIYYKNWPKPSSGLDNLVRKHEYFKPGWLAM